MLFVAFFITNGNNFFFPAKFLLQFLYVPTSVSTMRYFRIIFCEANLFRSKDNWCKESGKSSRPFSVGNSCSL